MCGTESNFLAPSGNSGLRDSSGVGECSHHKDPEHSLIHGGDSPLHEAACKGDTPLLASLISACGDVDVLNDRYCTPLHLAIRSNHAEAVRVLLSAGADPSLEDTVDGAVQPPHDAVHLAAWTGAQHAMGALIDAGLKIPSSVFERCASLNKVHCMETILAKLSGAGFSDRSTIDGVRSAMREAACCWHLEAVELLLTHVTGFPDKNSPEDQTALGKALASATDMEYICIDDCRWIPNLDPDRLTVIREKLIAAGADVEIERNESFWRAIGDSDIMRNLLEDGLRHDSQLPEGQTPLFGLVLSENDDVSLVEAIIARGADVNHRDSVLKTPMHYASNQATAGILHQHGADLFAKDSSGMTPLHMACKYGYLDVVQYLLSKGAAVNEAAMSGHTPLLYVTAREKDEHASFFWEPFPYTETSRLEVAKVLLDHGADIRAAPADGETVLHKAVWLDDIELIRYLVEHGANVQAIAANNETPLHIAACKSNIEVVHYLIDQGADTHAVTTDGQTTVHSACWTPISTKLLSISQVLGILLDSGVEVNARDNTGSTALHLLYNLCYRYHRCSTETFNLLLRRGANKLIANNEGKNMLELIEKDEKWDWDAEGFLKAN